MISVADALRQVLSLAVRLPEEEVPLRSAAGRVLSRPVAARRSQPPFPSSSMDGYAVAAASPGIRLRVVGEAAAGRGWDGCVGPAEAVRIFTGAPVPQGAERVVVQEDVRREGEEIILADDLDPGLHVRPLGADFAEGDELQPRRLGPADVALLAAMNMARVPVVRRPVVALIATGDELVMPGEEPGADQIVSSNAFGLAAMIETAGAEARILPIARDNAASLRFVLDLARGADLIVTIGGASVGDHDIVADVTAAMGMELTFHKVAMRPGKPLMAGRLGDAAVLGLPGNPVSAMVCSVVFMLPMLDAMLGLARGPAPRLSGVLADAVGSNSAREHYMRARQTPAGLVTAGRQDSSLLSVLAESDALLVRPPHAPPLAAGEEVEFIPLPRAR